MISAILLQGANSHAEVRLPGFFTDHMVLQRQMPLKIWGWADPGEQVRVTLGDATEVATAGDSGRWSVSLPAMNASSTPLQLTVEGSNTLTLSDILIGEVWLCSGQSNMEWRVSSSTNAEAEIAAADFPLIRHVKIPRRPSPVPLEDVDAEWQVCSPATAGSFTACGYFMARQLHQELDVPIGLVNSSWGGTRVEPWTPPIGFENVEALASIHQSVIGRMPGSAPYRQRLTTYLDSIADWQQQAQAALEESTLLSPAPAYPAELTPFKSHQDPTMLYNGMIHALVGFPMRGAIWYQGESNHAEGMLYTEKKRALINGWRTLWEQGDFPFYYVQIAPFQYGNEDPKILARFWEAQAAVQEIPNTGMVVINDIATLNDIHPPNKQDVGLRLAGLALKHDYGLEDLVANSPEMSEMKVLSDRIEIEFHNTGGGLKTRDGEAPSHFELIGPNSGGFRPASAKIDGNTIVLTAADVPKPTAFRFAWHKLAEPNLMGESGLPVGAFRGGKLPDFFSTLPVSREYRLVYDLDLSQLGAEIKYTVDKSADVTAFDRIGYVVELETSDGTPQNVFVSMKAFTSDAAKIGIPTVSSGAHFQQRVEDMEVISDVAGIVSGSAIATGNIEFWPNNYGQGNSGGIPGASSGTYDFGDSPGPPENGYGCMQVHNHAARQTLFAINHWSQGSGADIGIGNSTGPNPDWTFTGNASSYRTKRLRVYVRQTSPQVQQTQSE